MVSLLLNGISVTEWYLHPERREYQAVLRLKAETFIRELCDALSEQQQEIRALGRIRIATIGEDHQNNITSRD